MATYRDRNGHMHVVPGGFSAYTAADFDAFAAEHDAFEIRTALNDGHFVGEAGTAAELWLARHDHAQSEAAAEIARTAQQRSTAAAERSARWGMVAAIAAAVSALAAAAAVIVPLVWKK
jgi:hypothetical protein